MSDVVKRAAKLALAAGLLKASSGYVILPTVTELRGPATTEGPRRQGGGVAAADGAAVTAGATYSPTAAAER